MDEDILDQYLAANVFGEGPDPDLPWSHLNKPGHVLLKNGYERYWGQYLEPITHRIFHTIMYHQNYETGACFPSRSTLAKAVKHRGKPVSEKTVSRKIGELEGVGLLEIVRPIRRNGPFVNPRYRAGGRTNRYVINYDRLAATDEDGTPVAANITTRFFLTLGGRVHLPHGHPWIVHEDPKQMRAHLAFLRIGIVEPTPDLFDIPAPRVAIKPLKSYKHRPDIQAEAEELAQYFLVKAFDVAHRVDKVPTSESEIKDTFGRWLGATTVECTLDHIIFMIDQFFDEWTLNGRPNADIWSQFENQKARLFNLAKETLNEQAA
ncbi:helix-turn-helix domain-containing protein [Frankia sp. AiPs1]|uniref:helix-turn-helix domain-containing protein n=1 Tax=Frankia sp. AiPs1 TaxID=573493 RepID=UPI002043606D|nr:helix-turn-helix domain-containing protein [Frankia sp. AiPs1]MCM3920642.1 helix-turn-helix domain-containing protein [Frankia sp. AiPs1]